MVTLVREACGWLWRSAVVGWCLASCAILFAAPACRAEETVAPELGVLAPVQVECRIIGRQGGVWWPPASSFVLAETLQVTDDRGTAFEPVAGDPQRGQFAWRAEGAIKFSPEDAGRRIIVRYQFRPRRAAILAGVPDNDYRDALPMFGEALSEELPKRGFVIVSAAEVAEATAAEGLGEIALLDPPSAEKLAALAKRLNAAYLLAPYVDVTHFGIPGEVEVTVPVPTDRPDRPGDTYPRAQPFPTGEESVPVPVTRHSLQAGVRVSVVEGATGKVVMDPIKYATRAVHLRQFATARRELLQDLAGQVVVAWREPQTQGTAAAAAQSTR